MTIAENARKGEKAAALSPELIQANLKHRAKAALAVDKPKRRTHDAEHVHAARAPPADRILSKAQVLAIAGVGGGGYYALRRMRTT